MTMNDCETLADIVAALRHNSKGLMFYLRENENGSTHAMGADYADLADRIEAAWKREKAEIEAAALEVGGVVEATRQKPVGDAAAMREAMVTLLNLAYEVRDINSEHGPKTSVPAQFIIDVIKSALASPPRNCDVYDSYGDAIRAFEDDENAEEYDEMAEWLYAPATEQKGETNEQK